MVHYPVFLQKFCIWPIFILFSNFLWFRYLCLNVYIFSGSIVYFSMIVFNVIFALYNFAFVGKGAIRVIDTITIYFFRCIAKRRRGTPPLANPNEFILPKMENMSFLTLCFKQQALRILCFILFLCRRRVPNRNFRFRKNDTVATFS